MKLLALLLALIIALVPVNAVPEIKPPSRELLPPPLDDTSKETLCPPGMAHHNETGDCHFLEGNKPCGKNMVFTSDENDPSYGVCVCKYGRKSDCIAKPVVFWNKTKECYPLFEQGPCKDEEWLVPGKDDQVECVRTVCTLNIPREVTIPSPTFVFVHNNTCYKTYEKAFCSNNDTAVFLGGNDYKPKCVSDTDDMDPCYPSELEVASLQGPRLLHL